MYEKLFEPYQLGSLTLKNRIIAGPTMLCLAHADGSVSRELIDYYKARAKGGAAVVTAGESAVDNDYAITHWGQLNIGHDRMIPGLARLADAIKQYGALASLELCHGGRQSMPSLLDGREPIAPTPIPSKFHEFLAGHPITVQEMDTEMIESVIENFAMAAFRLKRAGFDMCLVHGGHGWMISQWLSPFANKRTDEYGGSLENRARFPLEVVRRIREKVGPDFGIEFRFSADERIEGGFTLDEAVQFARMIEDSVDCLHVSTGILGVPPTAPYTHPSYYLPHGPLVHLAEKIKSVVKIPVTTIGSISDPGMMEEIIKEGKADFIAMTRALIADPDLPNKARQGKVNEIRPCTRCLECLGSRVMHFLPIQCAVNPVAGRETDCAIMPPSARSKKILIVGGGPGGMQAAITAVERGHSVVLVEKEEKLGGDLRLADTMPFKKDLVHFREFLIETVQSMDVSIRLGTECTQALIDTEKPDVVIVASSPKLVPPNIPGISSSSVVWAGDVHKESVQIGQKIVVAGGGMIGSETAMILAEAGKDVTLVETKDEIAADVNPVIQLHLQELVEKAGVRILTNHLLQEIKDNSAVVQSDSGELLEAPFDTFVLAFGTYSQEDVARSFEGSAPEVFAIEDCIRPGKSAGAIRDAFDVVIEL